jgi:hypothetical protein
MRGKGHEPPLTVLAEDELPMLADPVERDDPVLVDDEEDADGVGVVVVVDDVSDDVESALVAEVPAWVWYAATPSTATAIVPVMPKDAVSFRRRRSARSRPAVVIRRFGAAITGPPGTGLPGLATRCERTEPGGAADRS